RTFRTHLWISGAFATFCFAVVLALSIFLPIAMQLGRVDLRSAEAYGLAQHFLFLHSALWPLVLLSLIASVVTANVLFQRMREPLVRYVRCYDAISEGAVPAQLTIRAADYLAEETDALNAMIASLRLQQTVRADAVARLEEAIAELAEFEISEGVLADLQDVAKRLQAAPVGAIRDVPAH
ncbi:hypothetical protein K2X89_13450, partial [Myxococcota bacterium]|nr:hypothetical protein [Myxococcota bacterium]